MRKYRLFFLVSLALAFGLVSKSLAQVTAPPLPLDNYWELVKMTSAQVKGLREAQTGAARVQLGILTGRWKAFQSVSLPDGATVPVDNRYLISLLEAEQPDLPRLNETLITLLAERETWPQEKFSADDLHSLEQILARPDFQWTAQETSSFEKWLSEMMQRLWKWLARVLKSSNVQEWSPFLQYSLLGLGIFVLGLALAFALRGVWKSVVGEAELDTENQSDAEGLSAESAFKKAQALSGSGDYRAAVRYLYLSSLLLLEERGLLRYDRTKTNREYLRSVAHLPALQGTLQKVIEVFDRVWYGYQPLDESGYSRFVADVTELQQKK